VILAFRIVLLTALLAAPAHAGQQDDLEKLRKRIAALQQEVEKANESKAEVADDLRESERAISDSNRRLHDLARQQQTANRELGEVRQRETTMQREMQGQQARLGRLLYQQYLDGGEQEYLRLLLNNDDPNQVARELQYYRYIARERADELRALRRDLVRLSAVTAEARRKSDEVAALRAEEQAQRQRLEKDRRARQQTLQKIALQLKKQRGEIGRLQKNESRLSQLVGKLSHLLPAPPTGALPSGAFKTLKGRLALPVKGKPANRFGARRPEGNLPWTGWFLRAPASQPVKTVAAGRVVYADWLRGFGNLIIVDHGQGYMSLYGYNETLYKQVGESIRDDEVIAAVGNSGSGGDSGLYFELRFEGKPLDPALWVRKR
jgi:septal ring factor EnvC (AmiA/AmiB activator)